ncbi:NAD(P)H-binding protein [Litoribacter ruber]|uniref:NAD(P)H-binding protein n=1 Tax=Litoribacter ruber TaxID=702568 RepID=A0AAP2G4Z8_9BACT|nr:MULTISPECIES: NAD(P)H-binding protein [Litoribacter]MBS9524003.1 NAD(P)H-binding protein [Litoribacter alkaliphilus]MBT0811413.1 NAD(P)H-binding protein [Litoribacter ruber]
MQITILGATGQVGGSVLREALKKNYQVKVLVRSPEKLNDLRDKVTVVTGNLLDADAVEKALQGSAAVINAAGGVKEPDQFEKFQRIGQLLTGKMNDQGIKRLVNISGAVSALPNESLDLQRRIMKVFVSILFKEMKQAQEALMPIIISNGQIYWTFVRAAMITKKAGTGKVLADDKRMPGTSIRLDDLGMFLVDQVSSDKWVKKAPLVASKT